MVFFVLLLSCQVMMYGQAKADINELLIKAERGDSEAQYALGRCYLDGNGVAQDYAEAVKWYRRAAEQMHAFAEYDLGCCYYNGWGISQDYYQAVKWLRKAGEQGHLQAQCILGRCYKYGIGVPQDYVESVKWYRMAAYMGYAEALCELGTCYAEGKGVPQDYVEAEKWWRKAAERGYAGAQQNLGWCYFNGKGVPQDYEAAVRWFRKAAEQGNSLAQSSLANLYLAGYGVPQDYVEAAKLWRMAAEQGLADAQYCLGFCYINGYGVAQDYGEAAEWFRKAAEQGNEYAKEALAWMESPDNVDMNVPQARTRNGNTFAVIIANENYKRLDSVPYAKRDGQMFTEYCKNTLGIPTENIIEYDNATYGDMLKAISDIKSIAAAYRGELNVLFYYAGHGAPMEGTQEAYLLPVDSYGAHSGAALSLDDLYSELGKMGARTTTVFLDACFSGASREGGMLASARGVAVKPKEATPTAGNVVVLSAASGEETALPYEEMKHGMFTYYLLKKLKESKGDVTLGELSDYVIQNVRQRSAVVNRKSQTPTVLTSGAVAETWRSIKLAR